MITGRPQKIAIEHDEYHAEFVGVNEDGLQFFLTTPFEPANRDSKGCEYVALFTFDSNGTLVKASIDTLGPRGSYSDEEKSESIYSKLKSLGKINYSRIEVRPFSVKHNGIEIGLIVREPEDEGDVWAVEMLPGNYMAFFEPWDSGEYDT